MNWGYAVGSYFFWLTYDGLSDGSGGFRFINIMITIGILMGIVLVIALGWLDGTAVVSMISLWDTMVWLLTEDFVSYKKKRLCLCL